jgi:hypothetical protein
MDLFIKAKLYRIWQHANAQSLKRNLLLIKAVSKKICFMVKENKSLETIFFQENMKKGSKLVVSLNGGVTQINPIFMNIMESLMKKENSLMKLI